MRNRGRWNTGLWLLQALLCSEAAFAGLGDRYAPGAANAGASTGGRTKALYTVHESTQGSIKVREYLDLNGNVFAEAWEGNTHPDLAPVLGSRFDDYSKALAKTPPGNLHSRHGVVQGNDIIVEKRGHGNRVRGRAYVPSLVPAGLDLSQIH